LSQIHGPHLTPNFGFPAYYIVEMLGSGGTGVVERRVVIAEAN
jgi:hypothetical protein